MSCKLVSLSALMLAVVSVRGAERPATAPADAKPHLTHRYSFTSADGKTVKDLAGNADITLKNAATVEGGKLVLKNADKTSGDPAVACAAISGKLLPDSGSVTLAIWFMAKESGDYARLIDIGTKVDSEGSGFIYVTPHTADQQARVAISQADAASKSHVDSGGLDDGKMHLLVTVIDGTAKKVRSYVDGKEVGEAMDLGDNTLDKIKQEHAWLGRSSFDNDAGLSASIDEFRIYDGALTGEENAAIAKAGPDELP